MTVLVTGGAGYIGSHTVRLLAESGLDVVAFDSMEFGHRAAVGKVPLLEGDIADTEAIRRTVTDDKVDSVTHFAAYKSPAESMQKPERYFETTSRRPSD